MSVSQSVSQSANAIKLPECIKIFNFLPQSKYGSCIFPETINCKLNHNVSLFVYPTANQGDQFSNYWAFGLVLGRKETFLYHGDIF